MKKGFFISFLCLLQILVAKTTPAEYWIGLDTNEKIAFINGAYGTITAMKTHHAQEVKKQYSQHPGWVEPYYIERFYEILDEHLCQAVGYDLTTISRHMDSLYSGSDNVNIPLIEALRIVSLSQDGEQRKADLLLLKSQRKYSHTNPK